MNLIHHPKLLGKTLKNAARIRKIVSVFANHGFKDVLDRLKLTNTGFGRWATRKEIETYSTAERLRMSFEELGPTFIKLGQILASRPDIIPPEVADEFRQLQHKVQPIPFSEIQKVDKVTLFGILSRIPLPRAYIVLVRIRGQSDRKKFGKIFF